MTNQRFIQSIVATAQTTSVKLPWHRDLRAQKVQQKRQNKVITLHTTYVQKKFAA